MKNIEEKILKDGMILNGDILKVDSFLNHQIDVKTLRAFAEGVKEHFAGQGINKILTIETSGIAVAYAIAEAMGDLPLVYAKKSKSATVGSDVYTAEVFSFTRGVKCDITVCDKYLTAGDRVLIADDFLAAGSAAKGLMRLCEQAGAKPIGLAVMIEKRFQGGHDALVQAGLDVFAGASISAFKDGVPQF